MQINMSKDKQPHKKNVGLDTSMQALSHFPQNLQTSSSKATHQIAEFL